jgi:hypothetical protein
MRLSGSPVVVVLVVILGLAPLLYVASTGPIVWFATRGYIPDGIVNRALTAVYWPLEKLADHCKPVSNALELYLAMWAAPQIPAPTPPPAMAQPVASPTASAPTGS